MSIQLFGKWQTIMPCFAAIQFCCFFGGIRSCLLGVAAVWGGCQTWLVVCVVWFWFWYLSL